MVVLSLGLLVVCLISLMGVSCAFSALPSSSQPLSPVLAPAEVFPRVKFTNYPTYRTSLLLQAHGHENGKEIEKESTTRSNSSTEEERDNRNSSYKHTLSILTLPQTAKDRIANEAILETSIKYTTQKLSIVLRCQDSSYRRNAGNVNGNVNVMPKIHELRGYVGEIYSLVWDSVLALDQQKPSSSSSQQQSEPQQQLLDVIIYPQNLPNAAPEQWLHHRPDLQCICSHDSITGWTSATTKSSRGFQFSNLQGTGLGGLQSHVEAVNMDRRGRGLEDVDGLMVENWPEVCAGDAGDGVDYGTVVFLEDEDEDDDNYNTQQETEQWSQGSEGGLIGSGHYRIPSSSLYNSVAVGGTFDGMHYGHRKLLTLAISSVIPNGGKLLIGVTTDEMLQQKAFADLIPTLKERINGVRDFVDSLAPGMKNRIKIIPITDKYGPPGMASSPPATASSSDESYTSDYEGIENDFDALVLSHETLPTGKMLNEHRVKNIGLKPLTLLCTRRTEAHGMSSTVLRRLRKEEEQRSNDD